MAEFDPMAHLAALKQENSNASSSSPDSGAGSQGDFDPMAHLAKLKAENETPQPSKLDGAGMAALEHFGQGASLGYLPQLQAAAEPVMNKALDLFTGNHVSDDDDSGYVQRRDQNSHRLDQESKEHPYASLAGTVAGGLATGIAASPALASVPGIGALSGTTAGEGAGIAARAAALGARTAGAMGQGAIIGGVANPGDTEGEISPLQLGDRAKNAAVTGMVSGPLHLAGEGVAAGAGALSDMLGSTAEKLAYRAFGPRKRFALQDADRVNDIGREALDSGVVGWKPTNAAGLAERAGAAKDAAGQKIEQVVGDLASQENVPTLSRSQIATNLRSKLLADEGIPGVADKNAKLSSLIDEFEQGGSGDDIPLRQARDLKVGVGDQVKWDRLPGADVPPTEEFHRALYGELKNGEEGIAESLAKTGQIPDGDALLNAKQSYANQSAAQRIAQDRAGSDKANQILGLKDTIAGGVGAGIGAYAGEKLGGNEGMKVGAAIGGGVGALGNKVARTYGSQISAKAADALSGFLKNAPALQALAEKNPAIIPVLAQRLIQKDEPQSPDAPPAGISPDVLGMIQKNPSLIDSLDDDKLKDQLRKYVKRKPADTGANIGYNPDEYLNKDDAKNHYLQGN